MTTLKQQNLKPINHKVVIAVGQVQVLPQSPKVKVKPVVQLGVILDKQQSQVRSAAAVHMIAAHVPTTEVAVAAAVMNAAVINLHTTRITKEVLSVLVPIREALVAALLTAVTTALHQDRLTVETLTKTTTPIVQAAAVAVTHITK